jgi:3-dehydroquinate synthase class II
MKKCSTCKEDKPINEFFKDKRRPDGYEYSCKVCAMVKKDNNDYKKKYNISLDIYNEMAKSQNYKCKICKTTEPGTRINRFCVDHCHVTKNVRGLLCGSCNRALGQFKDNPEFLKEAANYLESQ